MINVISNVSQPASFGMPASARVLPTWTRALPVSLGEVSVMAGVGSQLAAIDGTRVCAHGYAPIATAKGTFPGTSVWSPPT